MAADVHLTPIDLTVDQAIFTSSASMAGRGYRVTAASAGVTAEERKFISATSPSHNALCDESESATAIAFQRLESGRFCVARTRTAGQEQSGRGGFRLLTQSYLLTPEQFALFDHDPFAVLRAAAEAGAFTSDHTIAGTIEAVRIAWAGASQGRLIDEAVREVGEPGVLQLLSEAMTGGRLILAGGIDSASCVFEGVLLAMPSVMRRECSLAIGMKFALARRHRLNVIGEDATDAKRITKGQKIKLIEALGTDSPPNGPSSPWLTLVSDCRRMNKLDDLVAMNRLEFDDTSAAILERVARRQIGMNHLGETTIDALFDIVTTDEPIEESAEIVQAMDRQSRIAAGRELIRRVCGAPMATIKPRWRRLCDWGQSNAEFAVACDSIRGRFPELDDATDDTSENELAMPVTTSRL